MPTPEEAWTAALDDYERSLLASHALLTVEDPTPEDMADIVANWSAPVDIGPIPEHLMARAEYLAQASEGLMHAYEDRMGTVRHRLEQLPKPGLAPKRPAVTSKIMDTKI